MNYATIRWSGVAGLILSAALAAMPLQEGPAERPAAVVPLEQLPAKAIARGMDAALVQQRLGAPDEVKPMTVPDGAGAAEVWIYRRVARQYTTQTAATTETIMVWKGLGLDGDGIRPMEVPSQRIENVKIYQMTALLLVNGRVVEAKQWKETTRSFGS